MPRPSTNPFSAQKELLAAEQARLEREMAAALKLARQKPKPARASLEPGRKINVSTTPVRTLPPRPREHLYPGGSIRATRKLPRRRRGELRNQQVKFLVLCFVFVALILLVWRNFP